MTKDELIKAREDFERDCRFIDEIGGFSSLVRNDFLPNKSRDVILKALDAQIKACDVPKIEGLGEALTPEAVADVHKTCCHPDSSEKRCKNLSTVIEAARAFHKITGGDDGI
jgi:hypothetical protein